MKKLILMPFVFLLFCCSSTKKAADQKPADVKKQQQTALYQILSESAYQGKEVKSYEVIKDQASLEKLYEAINDNQVPKIDFAKERVVALFMGQRNTGGHAIKVKNVTEKGGKIYVDVQESSPGSGDIVTMALTNPFTIVKINSTKEILFQ
ncbi:protease complex subunit PrcB family protein [Flavobacterium microcysteis]